MYRRSTTETTLTALAAPLQESIARHARDHQLLLDAARVWLTHSENPPSESFFGKLLGRRANPVDPDAAHDTVVVLLPTWVLVATNGAARGTAVLSLALAQASLSRGSALAAAVGAPEANDGVMLSGFPGHAGRPGSFFVGLGPDAAGEECRKALTEAITRAKNAR